MVLFAKPPRVYIRDTGTAKGRGVFALNPFKSGEVVEESPVILISILREQLTQELRDIVFHWDLRADGTAISALALGYGSLYNSDNPSNLRYETDKIRLLIRFVAARDIASGEELTINYSGINGAPVSKGDSWFDEKRIKPIKN
jgi:SET domain-containing protein